MKKTKQEKAITLVALIITIIILLILAVVTIDAVKGDGIIGKAKKAVEDMDDAKIKEMVELAWMDAYLTETDEEKTDEWYYNYVIEYLKSNGVTQEKIDKYIITANKNGANAELKKEDSSSTGELNSYGFYYDRLYTGTKTWNGETYNIGLTFNKNNKAIGFIKFNDLRALYGLEIEEVQDEYIVMPEIEVMDVRYEESAAIYIDPKTEEVISKIEFSDNGKKATIDTDGTNFLGEGSKFELNTAEGIAHSVYWSDIYQEKINGVGVAVKFYKDGSFWFEDTENDIITELGKESFAWDYDGYCSAPNVSNGTEIFKISISFDGNIAYLINNSECIALHRNSEEGEQTQVSHNGIIPKGGKYYVGVGNTHVGDYTGATAIFEEGDAFPNTVSNGDIYVYGDYEYRYNALWTTDGWNVLSNSIIESLGVDYRWSAKVKDTTKTTYDKLLEQINNQYLGNLGSTYVQCESLEKAPKIPPTVISLEATFSGCKSLISAPAIPSSVVSMHITFSDCEALETAPDMTNASNLKYMQGTFDSCIKLVNVGAIPSSVIDLTETFEECTSLTGDITINAEPTEYDRCFRGTTKPIKIIGNCSATTKDNLAKTSTNNNITY